MHINRSSIAKKISDYIIPLCFILMIVYIVGSIFNVREIHQETPFGLEPWIFGAILGAVGILASRVGKTIDPTVLDRSIYDNVFFDAVYNGDISKIEELIPVVNNINIRHAMLGNTALHFAAYKANHEIVELLIRNGADPAIKNFAQISAKDIALANGNVETIRVIEQWENENSRIVIHGADFHQIWSALDKEKDPERKRNGYKTVGSDLLDKNYIFLARDSLLCAEELSLKIVSDPSTNRMILSDIQNKLGCIHYTLKQFDKSIKYFTDALQGLSTSQENEKLFENKARTIYNIGNSYLSKRDYANARKYYEQARHLAAHIKYDELSMESTRLIKYMDEQKGRPDARGNEKSEDQTLTLQVDRIKKDIERETRLRKNLTTLSSTEQQIEYLMYFYYGYKEAQIATRTNTDIQNVHNRIKSWIKKAKEYSWPDEVNTRESYKILHKEVLNPSDPLLQKALLDLADIDLA